MKAEQNEENTISMINGKKRISTMRIKIHASENHIVEQAENNNKCSKQPQQTDPMNVEWVFMVDLCTKKVPISGHKGVCISRELFRMLL